MPRPKKQPDDVREKHMGFRATEQQRLVIRAKAAAANLTVSDYLLRSALHARVVARQEAANGDRLPPELHREIRAIGVNVNQWVKLAHFEGVTVPPDIADLHEKLDLILDRDAAAVRAAGRRS